MDLINLSCEAADKEMTVIDGPLEMQSGRVESRKDIFIAELLV